MSWRQTLETLQKQFEAQAARSGGLHHLMVEVTDDARDRMAGPDWFARENGLASFDAASLQRGKPWSVMQSATLPGVHPYFREVRADESLDGVPTDRMVSDSSGTPRAILEPMRLRHGYLCGDSSTLSRFESLADSASRTLIGAVELKDSEYSDETADLFANSRGGTRYTFGTVVNPPQHHIAHGWQAGVLTYPDGVLIDLPIAQSSPSASHWLVLLHKLAWRRVPNSPLQAERFAWHENMTVGYDWLLTSECDPSVPEQLKTQFAQVPRSSYYSTLGNAHHPIDVNLASAFAISLLLSADTQSAQRGQVSANNTDYSQQVWYALPMPQIVDLRGTGTRLKKRFKPQIVLLTATRTERDIVLKHLESAPESPGIGRFTHQNNTYFLGRLGGRSVAVSMCSMGAAGRDSAQIVTGEIIRYWKPSAIIMVGIAFGRDSQRHKIGDVLVSEQIIAYEPQRVGSQSTIHRGQQYQPGTRLLNAFRNADVDWSFCDPHGSSCKALFGAILSGEKLVDSLDFKSRLFETHPNAIGGEMEGVGVAACADRLGCEWLLVKGICDWADGQKSDSHHAFAATAAVSFVRHVLSRPGALG